MPASHARKDAEPTPAQREGKRGRPSRTGFSEGGSVEPDHDHNPIIDDGAPKSTGGIESAARLCDMFEVKFEVKPAVSVYYQGWGHDCANPKLVKCTWTLRTQDKDSHPVDIQFDLTDGNAPLIVGIDFLQHADTCNRREPRVMRFLRPCDGGMRTMFTYIAPDIHGNKRLRLEVIPKSNVS